MFLFLWSFLLVLHRHVKQGRTLLPTSLHLLRMEIMFQKWSKLVIRVTKDSICMKITDSKRDFDVASYKKSNYLYINVLYNQRLSTLYL